MTEGQETPKAKYERQVAADYDLRFAVHEMRKVYLDVREEAAYRRYERVAEHLNKRVLAEVQEWMQEVHAQKALVLALGTSGVDVEDEVKGALEIGESYDRMDERQMVEVVEVVLVELDGTVAYQQKVFPAFAFGGLRGTEYHGHTLQSLAGNPQYPDMVEDFRRAVEGRRVVAYNAPWAARVLAAEGKRQYKDHPLPELGIDDCVMAQRSRYAGFWWISHGEYRPLRLGSVDPTPACVARTVCDVIERYRVSDEWGVPESPYDPYDPYDYSGDEWERREHRWGWRDAQKPADYESPVEARARHEREKKEAEKKYAERLVALRQTGMSEEAAKERIREEELESWEDIPF